MSLWAFDVPIFESPDEPHHWAYAQYIHTHYALPPYDAAYLEGNQAPLYYIMISPFASHMDVPDSLAHLLPSGNLQLSCPPRFYKDCPGDAYRYGPIRRARIFTILISLVGVIFTGLVAVEISGSIWTGCVASILIGALPQFDFRAATVNNDAAAASFAAVAVYFILRMMLRPYSSKIAIAAAVFVAFAFLSKVNAVVVLPLFVLGILLSKGEWSHRLRRLWLLLVSLAVASPWIIHNLLRYRDLLGIAAMPSTVPMMEAKRPITDPYFRTVLPEVTWRSLIGYFGWMNILSPQFVYTCYAVLFFCGVAGLLYFVVRHPKYRIVVALLILVPIQSAIVFVYFNLTFPQAQGRLLFPCLGALAVLISLGLVSVLRTPRVVAIALSILVIALNAYILERIIYPAYWKPIPSQLTADVAVPDTLMNGGPLGALLEGHQFTQSFVAEHSNLAAIDLEVAGYTKHMKQGSLQLSLSDKLGGFPLASKSISATSIPGCCIYAHLEFSPMQGSEGKRFFVSLSTKDIALPEGITVFLSKGNVYDDGEAFLDGRPLEKDTSFRTFYAPATFCGACSARSE